MSEPLLILYYFFYKSKYSYILMKHIMNHMRITLLMFLVTGHYQLGLMSYLLLLSFELNYLDEKMYKNLSVQTEEVKKMLSGFIKKIKQEN